VAKAEWGVKRLCQGCGAKFYDFLKDPSTCPSCGKTFDPEALRARRSRSNTAKAAKPVAAVKKAAAKSDSSDTESKKKDLATEELDDEKDTAADSGDDDVLVDTKDLDGDDENVAAEVVKRGDDES
jgi:uncharacterized protein (TIGR02300 family)